MNHFDAVQKARKLAQLYQEDHIVFWDDDYLTYRIAKSQILFYQDSTDIEPLNVCYSDGSYDGLKAV